MKTEYIKAFKCNQCGRIYNTYNDALKCCAEIEDTFTFKCGECSKIFHDKNEADWCCIPKEYQPKK